MNQIDYLERIDELVTNLQNHNMNGDEICRFLALKTFHDLDVNSVAITQLTTVGTLNSRGSFGSRAAFLLEWATLPLSIATPIATAILGAVAFVFVAGSNWAEKFPALANFKDEARRRSVISIPLLKSGSPIGAITVLTNRRMAFGPNATQFFTAVASVISLAAITAPIRKIEKLKPPSHESFSVLTTRQMKILKALAQKKTNKEIAQSLGQSESTIKHETIKIYAHLNITGRNEAAQLYSTYIDTHSTLDVKQLQSGDLNQIAD